ACKAKIPPGKKFCGECGYKLDAPVEIPAGELSFDEKIAKIQRYLPSGLTEKILAQRDRIEGEHKQVTVMFCDLEGYTALTDKLGPEAAYSVMDRVYEILIHKVHDYEGTVNEMTGDGIMALFGAPIALEDAPQRAIRSSLAIHREMTRFNDQLTSEGRRFPPLKMRIGIHTGPVVVGTLGNDLRVEFKAVGDTVNLTSRIESLAEAGTTYVSEEIFKIAEGFFRYEALGSKAVKGKDKPVRVYRVIAPSTRRTRFDVSAERGLTPFVGRERERELLLDGYMRAKGGHGQALSLVSEAGVGKSRLLYEFRKAVVNENATFLEGKCLSYSRNVAYHPIIDILKANFDIRDDDDDAAVKNKVAGGLTALGVKEETASPYLLELLSVKDSGIDQIAMSPEARKDRTLGTLKRIVLKGAEIRPLIMAIEDLHWIDKSSQEALEDLLGSIAGSRVFLIFSYRPEYVHAWGSRSYHSQVNLNRLSNRESLAMMAYILGTEDIEPDLEDVILEKTEGIPFYIEEFIRSLTDLNVIEKRKHTYYLSRKIQDMSIPSTIQDVIMARVDALPEGAKEVLQTGSVIEREFSYQLLKMITGMAETELMHHLSGLKDTELIYERGIYPESSFIFKHALTREVVYDSILTAKKKQLHERIGHAIEALHQDNIVEHYGVLAEHFVESANHEKAAAYAKLAAKRAQKAASYNDAIDYGRKRVACLEKLPQSEAVVRELIDARVTLGLYYNQMSYPVKAHEAVEPVVELALTTGYKRKISHINTIMGTYICGVEGDYPRGIQHLEDALKIAEESSDWASLWAANHWLGHAMAENCQFDRALDHLNRALGISQAANLTWSISIMKSCIAQTVYNNQGNPAMGYQTSLEGLALAEESGDAISKAEAFVHHGISCYLKGLTADAESHLLEGIEYCRKIDYVSAFMANYWLGLIYLEKKQDSKSRECFAESSAMLKQRKVLESFSHLNEMGIAYLRARQHEKDIDIDRLARDVEGNKIKSIEGTMALWMGQILLEADEPDIEKAENWINRAIEADSRNGQIWYLGKDYISYATLFKRQKDYARAGENIAKAIDFFKQCGADGWVEKYEKELASLQ
ncbi:MAG: AAA family ATPase, partial [Deltaproteobacteria bacterium]|nr:AAA family ATPase [Deltaproteobacteria bacterium]